VIGLVAVGLAVPGLASSRLLLTGLTGLTAIRLPLLTDAGLAIGLLTGNSLTRAG
jgi:hypothetical protein